MGGRSSKIKGANAENEVSKIFNEALGTDLHRKLGQARDGADDLQIGHYRIEIKRRETLAMDQWCHQVEECCGEGDIPVVVYRRSREPWRVTISLDEFLRLIKPNLNLELK